MGVVAELRRGGLWALPVAVDCVALDCGSYGFGCIDDVVVNLVMPP